MEQTQTLKLSSCVGDATPDRTSKPSGRSRKFERTIDSNKLSRLTGLTLRQVQLFSEDGILQPVLKTSLGRGRGGKNRIFTMHDVIRARVALELRERGFPPRVVRRVAQEFHAPGNLKGVLVLRGHRVRWVCGLKSRMTIKAPEFRIIPRDQVIEECEGYHCQLIPLDEIARRVSRKAA